MTRLRLIAAAASLALPALIVGPLTAQDDAPDVEAEAEAASQSKGEARLSKLLEGRVAGEPQGCIRSDPRQRMQTIDGTAYVYGSGKTIYVQRTRTPDQINDSDTLVINRFSASTLCRADIATTIDPVSGIFTGAVLFDDFVPYTRVKDGRPGEG
jgi:hypothetical protein